MTQKEIIEIFMESSLYQEISLKERQQLIKEFMKLYMPYIEDYKAEDDSSVPEEKLYSD